MKINTFIKTAVNIPPNISILMRGQTGIGKSNIVKSIAKELKMPLIDVRGSTMSEGDVCGYPDIEGMKKKNIMTFCMPSWFVRACNEPVILFLDELNRSLPSVQQSFFQIVLDRELGNDENGNPYKIHEGTRIFAAVNHGNEYDVNDMDPALLRRFWTVDIEASVENWIDWAKQNNISEYIINFVKTKSAHFMPDIKSMQAGKVCPTPASWHRLNETLEFCNFDLNQKNQDNIIILYNIAEGFIGTEAAIEFSDYVKNTSSMITCEDILNNYHEHKEKISKLSTDKLNNIIERLGEHSGLNTWDFTQGQNAASFALSLSDELVVHMWAQVSKGNNIESIKIFHHFIGQHLVDILKNTKEI